jgi:agmatinase
MNYGGLTKEQTKFENSKIVIIPVPYDGTSTWIKGSDKGPQAIIEASANMELYNIPTNNEIYKNGIHTTRPIKINSNPQKVAEAVYQKTIEVVGKNKFPVIIGGEHSVSIGAMKAMSEVHDELTILQLDAHADLRTIYEKSKFNHACVMARAKEFSPVLQVGIRSMSVEESKHIDPDRVFYSDQIYDNDEWMVEVMVKLTKNVYITIDLDVFDPSIMPSTGTPEPGGLFWYEVLKFLKKVNETSNIVGFDVVELCPNRYNKAPDFLAAKLIYSLLSYKFAKE